jgi:SAM-dependent methyltransferase
VSGHRCPQCDSAATAVLLETGGLKIERCRSCGLGFQPVPALVEFEQAASCYGAANLAHRRAVQPQLLAEARSRLRWARRFAPSSPRLLEIGGATGEFCAVARDDGWEVTLVELSAVFADEARLRYGLEARREPVRRQSFPAESFDVIALFHVLEHLPRPAELLEAITPMMRPGGCLLVVVPNLRGRTDRFFGRWASSLRQPDHVYHHTPSTLRSLLERHGFTAAELLTREPRHHLFTSLFSLAGIVRRRYRARLPHAPQGQPMQAGRLARLPFTLARLAAPLTAPYRHAVEAFGSGHEIWCVARRAGETGQLP